MDPESFVGEGPTLTTVLVDEGSENPDKTKSGLLSAYTFR